MALTNFDQSPPPGYVHTGQYNPDGSLATRYVGNGVLPQGFNSGAFNPDGSLRWASTSIGGPAVATPVASAAPMFNQPTPAPVPAPPPAQAAPTFNLNNLFAPRAPTPLMTSQRSAPVQQAVNAGYQTRAANQAAGQQSITDFVKQVIESRPKANQYAQEEQNSISRIYGSGPGSVEYDLNRLNRQQQGAVNMAAQSAMNRATRQNNARRLTSPNSSYLDRLFGQDLMNIGVAAAGQGASQGRADLQYLQDARSGNVGRRQQLLDNLLNRSFIPVEAAQRMEGANNSLLSQLAGVDYSNNIYSQPEDAYMRRLGFLNTLMDNGYNIA